MLKKQNVKKYVLKNRGVKKYVLNNQGLKNLGIFRIASLVITPLRGYNTSCIFDPGPEW